MEITQKSLLLCIMAGIVLVWIMLLVVLKKLHNKRSGEEKIRLFLYEGASSKYNGYLVNLIDSFEKAHKYGIIVLGLFMLTRKVRSFHLEAAVPVSVCYYPTNKDVIWIGLAHKATEEDPPYIFTKLIANVPIENLVKNWDRFEEYARAEYRRSLEQDIEKLKKIFERR